jgi:galactokinase
MRRDSFTIRAPGRVNLIGEHVDYCGLPVLPMAIQYGITLQVTPRADQVVRLTNASPAFAPRSFTIAPEIPPLPQSDWGNYVQAAAQALARRLGLLHGFDAVVTSDLPVASGLSSSSALVVAASMALLTANDQALTALELATLLAEGERYVGTAGGGMDQAIIVGARSGHAARIAFHPLQLTHVPIPEDWRIVVASSLAHAEKSGAVQSEYNARGADTREARRLVAARLGAVDSSYRELLSQFGEATLLDAGASLDERLFHRFRHVVTEGFRVEQAVDALISGDLPTFGALLNSSHASLRNDFDVSTGALDDLVAAARGAGAAGARLTGAGFGGSIVAVTDAGHVDGIVAGIREQYYAPRRVTPAPSHLFVAVPSDGARLLPDQPNALPMSEG